MAALNWYIFRKKTGRLSLAGPKILAFGSHSMANFQSVLNCFIPNFKLKHEDLENIETDCVSTIAFNLHQIKRWAFFYGTPGKCYSSSTHSSKSYWLLQNLSSLGCLLPAFLYHYVVV